MFNADNARTLVERAEEPWCSSLQSAINNIKKAAKQGFLNTRLETNPLVLPSLVDRLRDLGFVVHSVDGCTLEVEWL